MYRHILCEAHKAVVAEAGEARELFGQIKSYCSDELGWHFRGFRVLPSERLLSQPHNAKLAMGSNELGAGICISFNARERSYEPLKHLVETSCEAQERLHLQDTAPTTWKNKSDGRLRARSQRSMDVKVFTTLPLSDSLCRALSAFSCRCRHYIIVSSSLHMARARAEYNETDLMHDRQCLFA